MLYQLVLLVVLSSLQPGILQDVGCDVNGIFQNINSNLVQLKNLTTFHIKEVMSLRADLSSLNYSVSNLSVCVQEYKQRTAAELAQLQTSLNTSQSSLTAHTQEVKSKLSRLTKRLSKHQQQTAAELAQIKTSLNTTQSSLTTHTQQVNAKLNTLTASFSQHQQQTASSLETASSKLNLLTSTIAQLSTDHQQIQTSISDVECVDTEESLQLYQNLQSNLTCQLKAIGGNMNTLLYNQMFTCGGTGGWRRVVYLGMTDPCTTCPSGWNMTGYSKKTCGRATDGQDTCDSVTFPVSGGEYSRVCGRIKAYQWGTSNGFHNYLYFNYPSLASIDDPYVDGISVTHSSVRQHIWTFVVGWSETTTSPSQGCPCDMIRTIRVPPFVGEDYFCESGNDGQWRSSALYSNDPLWDGENCLSSSTCCSLHNPPYFVKQLPAPTSDDIEARICLLGGSIFQDIAVELIELYVQ